MCRRLGSPCRVCKYLCCGIDCFKSHRDSSGGVSQCDTVSTMPPLDIAEEDLFLTEGDIRTLWPRLLRHMSSTAEQVEGCQAHIETLCERMNTRVPLSFLAGIYPPRTKDPWWCMTHCGKQVVSHMQGFWAVLAEIMFGCSRYLLDVQ